MGVCLAIAAADWIQPLILDWRPKMVGAILGGAFYAGSALAVHRGVRPVAIAVAALPLLPVGLLGAHWIGWSVPVQPDGAMVGILVGQIVAAILAVAWFSARSDPSERPAAGAPDDR